MKPFRMLTICFIALIFAISLDPAIVSAQDSYTYNIKGEAVPGPAVYDSSKEIYGEDLGIGSLRDPQDLFVSPNNLIYIADTGNNRIIVVDENFELVRVISEFHDGDETHTFSSPTGLFVNEAEILYVADYGNSRVVALNEADEVVQIVSNPTDQELIADDFRFRPSKLVVDRVGRMYVIAEGVLEGLMEFDETGVFSGYIGAPRVNPNLWDYLWRKIMTDAQKERSVIFVPTEYSSLDIDEKGFIYTTVSGGSSDVEQVIRRLNPAGDDVLRRRQDGFPPPMGDVDVIFREGNPHASIVGRSGLQDIVVRENGIYSVIDLTRGRVFTYDDNGNLLYAFGSVAFEKSSFRAPSAIDVLEDRLLILDRRLNLISVLEPTDYAKSIHEAIALYQTGDYDGSAQMWQEVLKQNPNLDLAYSGIGRSLLRQGEFHEAMQTYRLANDRTGYSQALGLYRRDWINANFSKMMAGLIVLILAVKIGRKVRQERQKAKQVGYKGLGYKISDNRFIAYLQSLSFAFKVIVSPFDGFWDLKHEKRGTVLSASTILGGVVLTYILIRQYTGFLFNMKEAKDLNIYVELLSVLIPFMLWCGVNLGLTSLMEGKGSFKDIYIATAYGLFPIILINLPLIFVSRVITLEEGAFYYVINTIAVIWSGFLVFVGMLVTHEYELGKNVFTSILTGVGMGIVIFLALLFFNVLAQLYGFIDTLYTEISFRL